MSRFKCINHLSHLWVGCLMLWLLMPMDAFAGATSANAKELDQIDRVPQEAQSGLAPLHAAPHDQFQQEPAELTQPARYVVCGDAAHPCRKFSRLTTPEPQCHEVTRPVASDSAQLKIFLTQVVCH